MKARRSLLEATIQIMQGKLGKASRVLEKIDPNALSPRRRAMRYMYLYVCKRQASDLRIASERFASLHDVWNQMTVARIRFSEALSQGNAHEARELLADLYALRPQPAIGETVSPEQPELIETFAQSMEAEILLLELRQSEPDASAPDLRRLGRASELAHRALQAADAMRLLSVKIRCMETLGELARLELRFYQEGIELALNAGLHQEAVRLLIARTDRYFEQKNFDALLEDVSTLIELYDRIGDEEKVKRWTAYRRSVEETIQQRG